jgi:hypothetical protein
MGRLARSRKKVVENGCELKGHSPCEGEVRLVASMIQGNRPAQVCEAHLHDVRWAEAMLLGRLPVVKNWDPNCSNKVVGIFEFREGRGR